MRGSVAQLDAGPTGDQEIVGSNPAGLTTFFRGDWSWNIFYGVILSVPLIQEGQLSVSVEKMCTILVNHLRGLSMPVSVVRQTDYARHDPIGLTGP